jgi:hypothetical protein
VFQAFSPQLTTGIFEEPKTSVPLVAGVQAECRSLDTSTGFEGSTSLTALFTANETGISSGVKGALCGRPLFAGESASGADVIFQTQAALTPGSQRAKEIPAGHEYHHAEESIGEGCAFGCNLYESSGGHVRLVSEIEQSGVMVPVPNATFGGYGGEVGNQGGLPNFSHAISSDGSRVENGTQEVKVSGPHSQYWTATPDGVYAYYTKEGQLFRFDTETNTSTPVTPAGADVSGVLGTNTEGTDGEYVYIVATGATPLGSGVEGAPNLYVIHGGTTSLIETGSGNDYSIRVARRGGVPEASPWVADLGFRQAEVSPDGTHLVFESTTEPTGFPNEEATEVYVYSAAEGKLVCASCDAAGISPGGHEGRSGKLSVSAESYTYVHRWMSADGDRVFFDTSQSLVSGDVNGVEDVYEWEREGTGSCPVRVPASSVGGCQFLLSGGESEAASFFVDADESGDNVFFVHLGPLGHLVAPFDHIELYDARVNGGFPSPSQACTGTGCQGVPPAPPSFATPATVTFAGNFPAPAAPAVSPPPVKKTVKCRKPKKLSHNRCIAQKKSNKSVAKKSAKERK